MHENMKTSMWHTGRSERTWRLPACFIYMPPIGHMDWIGFGFGKLDPRPTVGQFRHRRHRRLTIRL